MTLRCCVLLASSRACATGFFGLRLTLVRESSALSCGDTFNELEKQRGRMMDARREAFRAGYQIGVLLTVAIGAGVLALGEWLFPAGWCGP